MSTLSKELRNQLARTTIDAREASEKACRAALENLAVHEGEYRRHMTIEQRQLRNRLRARGRALGDELDRHSGRQEIKHLAQDAAYEHWHRLLFTRFLAENDLLHTDDSQGNVPVTLDDCEELAPDLGAKDGFDLACRFAERILPGVFRTEDPVFGLTLALNDQVELRGLLDSLPKDVFTATDSLGWTYQFWQTKRKEEVNASGNKIGADEISPVTQLFTEDYMVEFLLHNTLGAWWAGKLGPIQAASEEEARAKAALPKRDGLGVTWTYLRLIQNEETKAWKPAAGSFGGWPKAAKEITFLDPCMGSGHFPAFALPILSRMRMEEENLSSKEAIYTVLRDNIHGLELDPRCCQIGAFNLALTAWNLAGFQLLAPLQVACCGLAPQATLDEWLALAGSDERLSTGMERLYRLFRSAPVLGSLINPRAAGGDLLEAAFHELQPLLEKALAQETNDDSVHEMVVTARGLAKAAEILADQFTLVATNVPYLGRGKQDDGLADYCERVHPEGKADLATCFVERCLSFCAPGGSTTLVTPQNWLFLGSYKKLRNNLLSAQQWNWLLRLGEHAFDSAAAAGAFVVLFAITHRMPARGHRFLGLEVGDEGRPDDKAAAALVRTMVALQQSIQLKNPDARVSLVTHEKVRRLSEFCHSFTGLGTGDYPHYGRCYWEFPIAPGGWAFQQGSVETPRPWGGREHLLAWDFTIDRVRGMSDNERSQIHNQDQSGQQAWGKWGVAVGMMRDLKPTLYTGERHEKAVAALIPVSTELLPALWALCSSRDFHDLVRQLDQNIVVANGTLIKIPFDLAHWQKVAAESYPHGLPKPYSSDPTQWLFNGHPAGADQPLHVAVARLLGYQWPRQTGSSFPDCPALGPDGLEALADDDGIVCLPPLNREQPAASRLRALLAEALGNFDEKSLLAGAGKKGSKSKTLEDWLCDEFFEQHCDLFHQRPFLWHIWDGRKDGFAALINYHRLDNAALQKLTYTYLGNWIHDQEADAKADEPGAAERLGAAQTLQRELTEILEGEAPYDIFVRWKPLKDQPIGWHPDLNDGVRLNIRPFLMAKDVGKKGAGLLRSNPKGIKWTKDRGKEPHRPKVDYPWFWCEEEPGTDPSGGKSFTGNRWNDVHLTLELKNGSKS